MRFILLALLVLAACSQEVSSDTNNALREFLKGSSKPAVIKFYADWCDSCKDYAPTYTKVQAQQSKQVNFYSIDVDDKSSSKLIRQLKISRIPVTYFISRDRNNVSKKMGSLTEQELSGAAKNLLII